MARGWKEYRLCANGLWQYTGQLKDGFPFPDAPNVDSPALWAFDASDSSALPVRLYVTGGVRDLGIGHLAWSQFASPPEPRLPQGTHTSDGP